MNRKFFILMAVAVLVFCAPFAGFADENEVVALKNQVDELNQKLANLERQMTTMQGHLTAEKPMAASNIVPAGAETPSGLIRTLQDIHMGGFVDVQYSKALGDSTDHRTPAGALNATNIGRVFDINQDSFTINNVELDFQKNAEPAGGVGFRTDISMGEDAAIADFDPSTDQDEFSIQQAYAEYNAPVSKIWGENSIISNDVNLKIGRFVTLAGNEVIESKDNWNLSRSFAFGLAIPFTHTGLRSNFKLFNNFLDTYVGVNNGWDNVVDNNTFKTLEFGVGWSPIEKVTFFHTLYWGAENNDTNSHRRFLTTHVIGWDATNKLSFKGEFNQGDQSRVIGGTESHDADWQSYAGYARYQLTDKAALAYRAELFKQNELFRTALDNTLWSQTVTAEYKLADNMITRLEYRYDKANDANPFDLDSNQSTLGAQVIYLI